MESSRTNRDLQQVNQPLAPTPQTRADKIAQLRRAVESRTYGEHAEQIAEKMLREALVNLLA